MRFVPRTNVRVQLAGAILIAITLSWILSGGLANYVGYLQMSAVYQEMVKHPELYPRVMPEPRFGHHRILLWPAASVWTTSG